VKHTSKPLISLVGRPFRAENRGWSLSADAVDCLTDEIVSKPGAGSRFAGRSVSLRLRHVAQLLYRPRSGQGLEEVSVDLMALPGSEK